MTASDQADTLDNSATAASSSTKGSDSNQASTCPAMETSSADEALATAKKEAADNYERFLRVTADLENFRRRTLREKDELRQYSTGRVLEELLPVLDNLALGINAAKAPNADLKNLVGGIAMVQDQLRSALNNHGLKEINPVGQAFDPNHHESISSQPSNEVPEGSVLQVVRIGYSLNGRLLRPASVVVSTGSSKAEGKAGK